MTLRTGRLRQMKSVFELRPFAGVYDLYPDNPALYAFQARLRHGIESNRLSTRNVRL